MGNSEWIDLSVSLQNNMIHWPSDPGVNIFRISDMNKGSKANLTKLDMGAHTGTHMDGPVHFVKDGKSIDEMPLCSVIGRARVIEIEDEESIKIEELKKYNIEQGERILFKTANSRNNWVEKSFMNDAVYISTEAGKFLDEKGVETVGIDYLSIGGHKKNGVELHNIMLKAEIWVIEGLNLHNVEPGNYEMICLPIKIKGSDGAPARAVIRKV